MNIKRFEAPSVPLALEQVKASLGQDAVILGTRRCQRHDSASGAVSRMVEVVAAVDFDPGPAGQTQTRGGHGIGRTRRDEHTAARPYPTAGARDRDLAQEIHALKGLLTQVLRGLPETQAGSLAGGRSWSELSDPSPGTDMRGPLLTLHHILSGLGLEQFLQQRIAARFLRQLRPDQPVTPTGILEWLKAYGLNHIRTGPVVEGGATPCWWALIGPTGVGKTTTIAKLAARLALGGGRRGLLVTTDTYRVGGVDQLRRYAQLMEIPLEVAADASSLAKVFDAHRDKAFILVDTTGRGPGDPRHVQELGRLFEAVPGLKAQVLLCATAKGEDLTEAIGCYERFPVEGWILSKLDETKTYGPLCIPVLGRRLPISYITTGQRVPEDLQPASRDALANLLLAPKGEDHGEGEGPAVRERSVHGRVGCLGRPESATGESA